MVDGESSSVDEIIKEWRQGDVTLDANLEFFYSADLMHPLTEPAQRVAREIADTGEHLMDRPSVVGETVVGFVVISQTCDVVRAAKNRPFIEVAPLVEVPDDATLECVRRMKLPNRAYVPSLADRRLVADLDRVMTVEKSILANWSRVRGCCTDAEIRDFQNSLKRKRGRFAFPDDFEKAAKKFYKRLVNRAGKNSLEGRYVDSLAEIRVLAAPSWDAAEINLEFWLIKDRDPPGGTEGEPPGSRWHEFQKEWETLFSIEGRFKRAYFTVARHEDMTARDYCDSDFLDLDRLSIEGE